MTAKLTIQVTKTRDGKQEYVQIMSADQFSINVVLIADEIEITDNRHVIATGPKP